MSSLYITEYDFKTKVSTLYLLLISTELLSFNSDKELLQNLHYTVDCH